VTASESSSSASTSTAEVSDPAMVCGLYAADLIQHQTRRLGKLQSEVLADHDPEPLHQLRVSLRRLRTALSQFAPALRMPDGVSDRRIARVARRTSLCRDLDVLRDRLEGQLLPPLPEEERKAMKPVLKRLSRNRRLAFEDLAEALTGGPYLKLLARLRAWQLKPRFSPLGDLPLGPWLFEWQSQASSGLFLHGGWFAADPHDPALHNLRKRIKGLRYALEHLEPFAAPALGEWIALLKKAQDCLGDLHDLQVLAAILGDQLENGVAETLPVLQAGILAQQAERWSQWSDQAIQLREQANRHRLYSSLITFP
jgi:CHAD domain-containing protein